MISTLVLSGHGARATGMNDRFNFQRDRSAASKILYYVFDHIAVRDRAMHAVEQDFLKKGTSRIQPVATRKSRQGGTEIENYILYRPDLPGTDPLNIYHPFRFGLDNTGLPLARSEGGRHSQGLGEYRTE